MKNYAPLEDFDSLEPILSRISFLGGVTDTQREAIFQLMEKHAFKKGEYISRVDEEPSHIYIIASGKVELRITDHHGLEIRKRAFGLGDCFGEAAMLSMNNHTASFMAAEDTKLIMLSRRAINRLHHDDLKLFSILMMNLARELARKLQFTDEMLLKEEKVMHSRQAHSIKN